MTYTCRTCGESHSEIPLSFAADYPDMYANMSEVDRQARAVISSDQCIIDDTWYFLRGCLEIPILGSEEVFLWGLWAVIKEEVFNEISGSWYEEGREGRHGPFTGRLANSLAVYPDSFNARLRIDLRPVETRPLFTVEEPDCSIGLVQVSRISQTEAFELAAKLLHDEPENYFRRAEVREAT